jgi:L-arabinose isomerase
MRAREITRQRAASDARHRRLDAYHIPSGDNNRMTPLNRLEVWFVTGSQHLYGPDTLAKVAANSRSIAGSLNDDPALPVQIVWKPTLTTPEEVRALCRDANNTPACIGLVLWMHTFSPAKMWIAGLTSLTKPFLHLHTQFNRALPWATIDMDFMNLNQSAHG